MNKLIIRITTFLIILAGFYSYCAFGKNSEGDPFESVSNVEAADSLRAEKKQLKALVAEHRKKRDSLVAVRKSLKAGSVAGTESLATQQVSSFGTGVMKFSNSDLLMHLKLDTDGADASGNGNSGTPGGNYSFVTEAHFDGSIHCNGIANGATGTSGGHVTLPDLGLNNLTEFTVSIWVKDEKTTPDEGLIWFGDWHSGWGGIAHLWGSTRFHVGGIGTSGGGIIIPYESDDLGVWVMYTLVYDNGTMKAYKNGQYKDEVAVNVYIPQGQLCGLGQHWWGGTGQATSTRYTGKIDEVRVYSTAFTDADVLDLYNFTDPDQEPGGGAVAASADMNYILEYTPRIEGVDENTNIAGLPGMDRMANITYFDGLGRPVQQTGIGASSINGADIIVPIQYDPYGRAAMKFLPYTAAGDGSYQDNAIDDTYSTSTEHYQFYNDNGANNGVVDDTKPFSKTEFEPSPLNRVLEQGAPGTVWQPGTGNTVRFDYTTNGANEVFLWKIKEDQCILADGHYYDANELYVTVTKDEHWSSGNNNTVREYKDKLGRVVLKRTYNEDKDQNEEILDTYYVYDDFGNLRVVIPPEASKQLNGESWSGITESNVFTSDGNVPTGNPNSYYYCPGVTVTMPNGTYGAGYEVKPYPLNAALADQYLFVYKYDGRKRMTEKKVPGAEPVYMVYDKRDRLVLTQDGEQRKSNKWLFTKYDALNRPILTGVKVITGALSSIHSAVENHSTLFETRTGDWTGSDHGYTDSSYPAGVGTNDYLTVTYYDDYSFETGTTYDYPGSPPSPYDENEKLDAPKRQVTGGKVKNLDDNTWYENVIYYDKKYRPIYTVSENHLGGLEKSYSAYNFIGDVLNTQYVHTASGQSTLTIDKEYNYDHMSRLLSIDYKVNGANPATLLTNEYNEIGELVTRYLHGNSSAHKQQVDYKYNIRGWLTEINDPTNVSLSGDYFGMKLKYNEAPTAALNGQAQYNGNISEIQWQNAQTATLSGYGFKYDDLNRLRTSHFGSGSLFTSNDAHWDENLDYDYNGNITSLIRRAAGAEVDDLDYNYTGNRLNYVDDDNSYSGDENHFVDGNPGTSTDYTYDDNGNMITDANKGIASIIYNHLNLPQEINFGDGNSIAYIYDAAGIKLSKVVKESGQSDKETDYVGGIVYEDNIRKFIATEEGRIMLESTPEYQYHMKDHLGNVRLTFTTAAAQQSSTYMATMEPEVTTMESSTFNNIETTQQEDKVYNHTPGGKASARLNAMENRAMGPSMSLHVMPGDTVRMKVQARYFKKAKKKQPIGGMASIVAASIGAGAISEAPQIAQGIQETLGVGQAGLMSKDKSIPKAYLNFMFFDKEKNFKKGGFKQVSEEALGSFEELSLEYIPEEEGTMMIYTANQTAEPLNVYMDDMMVTHTEGPIVRADDYYSFGLTFNSSERSGFTSNKFLYNSQELQDELGLDTYAYEFRMYDPELGRWWQHDPKVKENMSPYSWVTNNPIRYYDLLGLDSAQRANAVAKAHEYVKKNPGETYEKGKKGGPGENVDCSGVVSACIKSGDESDPVKKGTGTGTKRIADNTETITEADVVPGNVVMFSGHTGLIVEVKRDKNGKITDMKMVDSGGTEGPRYSSLISGGKKDYWGKRITGYRKWDTKPDKANTTSTSKSSTKSQATRSTSGAPGWAKSSLIGAHIYFIFTGKDPGLQ